MVGEDQEPIYESLVKPDKPVVDHNTRYIDLNISFKAKSKSYVIQGINLQIAMYYKFMWCSSCTL